MELYANAMTAKKHLSEMTGSRSSGEKKSTLAGWRKSGGGPMSHE
jgi:hypothetical protein